MLMCRTQKGNGIGERYRTCVYAFELSIPILYNFKKKPYVQKHSQQMTHISLIFLYIKSVRSPNTNV